MNTPRLRLGHAFKLILAAMLALAAWATWRLPPATPITVHFDINGSPDAWTTHTGLGLLLYPGLALLTPLLLAGLLRILPAGNPATPAVRSIQPTLTLTMALLLAVLQWAALRAAFDLAVPIALPAFLLGGLLVGTGNGMAKLRMNAWVGIRTPWTLANPRVWDQTHRFGGWVFVLSGLALLTVSVAPLSSGQQLGLLTALMCFAGLAPVLKSYLLWRRLTPE